MKLVHFTHQHSVYPPRLLKQTIPFYELTFVLKGSLTYFINEQEYRIEEGEAVFLPKDSVRERPESKEKATYTSFNFLTDTPPTLPYLLQNIGSECHLLLTCADEIRRKYYPNSDTQIASICRCLLDNLGANVKLANEHPLIAKIKRFINEHLPEKITLQRVGEETYFSPLYCETVFKRETNTSIIRYLLNRRIEEAKRLLAEGSLPLKTVAEAVGFEDYNYFSRSFKKATGLTPREYRYSVDLSK